MFIGGTIFFLAISLLLYRLMQTQTGALQNSESRNHDLVEQQSQRMLEQQIAIHQLALSLGELKTLEEIYQIAYEHVIKLMDAESFIISFYDAKRQLIRAGFFIANGIKQDVSKFPPIPLEEEGKGTQSKVIRTGEPLTIPDFRAAMGNVVTEHTLAPDGEVFEGPPPEDRSEQSTNSAILVPFKDKGETVGVLQVQSYRLDAYAQMDVELLAALSNVISMAIQNARLYKETR
ncbi:MAG: GAF domain-containing protein, partial [Anaerolineae bacterium]|nr:GAF domain-containing protein [Anaerolineae bacterium]